ncbi:MAG: hypothetical protein JWQ27_2829 [Ferruginibacter sp.]|nr:hypothetical protein [Ferruginibacter sp.]
MFRGIFIANIFCLVLMLMSNLSPLANPVRFWPVALCGLIFPVLLAGTFCFFIFWLICDRKKAWVSFLSLCLSLPNIFASVGLNRPAFNDIKEGGDLRVVTWNVGLMNYTAIDSGTAIKNNLVILGELKTLNADVICLQELFTGMAPNGHYNFIDSISRTMGYPYHFFSFDYPKFDKSFYSGSIIFSKFPIVDTARKQYELPFAGSAIRAGILVGKDTINVITTRLQSFRFQNNEYRALQAIKHGKDSALAGSMNIIRKLKYGYGQRFAQVEIVRNMIAAQQRPVIFTGDLNDVPTSYAYTQLKKGLQDAWLEKGAGIGKTFQFISPTLRIDYIFHSSYFSAQQTKRIITDASDHNGLVTDLRLQKNR